MIIDDAPRNSKVKLLEEPKIPPAALQPKKDDILTFIRPDGMYAVCKDIADETVYVALWTEVLIV